MKERKKMREREKEEERGVNKDQTTIEYPRHSYSIIVDVILIVLIVEIICRGCRNGCLSALAHDGLDF
jgi:hypothetical protein